MSLPLLWILLATTSTARPSPCPDRSALPLSQCDDARRRRRRPHDHLVRPRPLFRRRRLAICHRGHVVVVVGRRLGLGRCGQLGLDVGRCGARRRCCRSRRRCGHGCRCARALSAAERALRGGEGVRDKPLGGRRRGPGHEGGVIRLRDFFDFPRSSDPSILTYARLGHLRSRRSLYCQFFCAVDSLERMAAE